MKLILGQQQQKVELIPHLHRVIETLHSNLSYPITLPLSSSGCPSPHAQDHSSPHPHPTPAPHCPLHPHYPGHDVPSQFSQASPVNPAERSRILLINPSTIII